MSDSAEAKEKFENHVRACLNSWDLLGITPRTTFFDAADALNKKISQITPDADAQSKKGGLTYAFTVHEWFLHMTSPTRTPPTNPDDIAEEPFNQSVVQEAVNRFRALHPDFESNKKLADALEQEAEARKRLADAKAAYIDATKELTDYQQRANRMLETHDEFLKNEPSHIAVAEARIANAELEIHMWRAKIKANLAFVSLAEAECDALQATTKVWEEKAAATSSSAIASYNVKQAALTRAQAEAALHNVSMLASKNSGEIEYANLMISEAELRKTAAQVAKKAAEHPAAPQDAQQHATATPVQPVKAKKSWMPTLAGTAIGLGAAYTGFTKTNLMQFPANVWHAVTSTGMSDNVANVSGAAAIVAFALAAGFATKKMLGGASGKQRAAIVLGGAALFVGYQLTENWAANSVQASAPPVAAQYVGGTLTTTCTAHISVGTGKNVEQHTLEKGQTFLIVGQHLASDEKTMAYKVLGNGEIVGGWVYQESPNCIKLTLPGKGASNSPLVKFNIG